MNDRTSALFDAAYVINLDSRPDRWEKIQPNLQQAGIQAERFSAISIAQLNTQPSEALKVFLNRVDGERPDAERKLYGTWACMSSHLAVIERAKSRGEAAVLILEDDCEFAPYAQPVVQRIVQQIQQQGLEWDMLYLGGTFKKGGTKQRVSSNLYAATRLRLTHAYIVRQSLYDRILEQAPTSGLPLDWYYSETLSKTAKVLLADPVIAHQRENDLSDIESVHRTRKLKLRKKIKHWIACLRYGTWPL